MTLTDGDVAALAERAAGRIDGPVEVRIEPNAGDDPYRWGEHYWVVHIVAAGGRRADVRVAADETEEGAAARLDAAVAELAGP